MKKEEIENWLRNRIAAELDLNADRVDAAAPLIGYLMNGFQSFSVVADLERIVGKRLAPSILYTRPTIAGLAEHLSHHVIGQERVVDPSGNAATLAFPEQVIGF